MKTTSILPKTNILFLIVLIGFILSSFSLLFSVGFNILYASTPEMLQLSVSVKIVTGIIVFIQSLLNIFLGLWLYKKSFLIQENKYTWFFFGLFFGIFAIILFYLVLIYKKLDQELS